MAEGCIPVVEGVKFRFQLITFNQTTGKWQPWKTVVIDPVKHLINGGKPISAKYLEKLAKTPEELVKEAQG
jgi:hypothetical protein